MPDAAEDAEKTVERLKALRAAQMDLIWPAAKAAAEASDHAPLIELIKVYTAIQAIDFAIAHRPDPNAATRRRPGF